jgi:DNA replication licensing factor MCM5
MVDGKGYSEQALTRALHVMAARETIRMRHGGHVVFRASA